jgi:hypothetical protein
VRTIRQSISPLILPNIVRSEYQRQKSSESASYNDSNLRRNEVRLISLTERQWSNNVSEAERHEQYRVHSNLLGMPCDVCRDPRVQQRQAGPDTIREVVADQLASLVLTDDARNQQRADIDTALVKATGQIGSRDDRDDAHGARGELQ